MHLDYVVCFYRPENHVPSRVFGGVCRSIADPRQCSEAVFAYGHVPLRPSDPPPALRDGSLAPADDEDLRELAGFCRHEGGGLMLGALALEPGAGAQSDLIDEYRRLGLKRERHVYALRRDQRLQAVAMVNLADVGINLSDLTNCITLFILDSRRLTTEVLHDALSILMSSLGSEPLPVLIYPESAAESLRVPVEKRYVMWSLVPQYSDGFHRYTNAILRAGRRNEGSHEARRPPLV